jgi:hypothetical protein
MSSAGLSCACASAAVAYTKTRLLKKGAMVVLGVRKGM